MPCCSMSAGIRRSSPKPHAGGEPGGGAWQDLRCRRRQAPSGDDSRAGSDECSSMRALFVNTGILGHASVARLIGGVLELYPDIDDVHLALVADLTLRERVVRKLICWGVGGANSMFNALTLARWRRELHAGIQAARRIRQTELVSGV